MELAPAPGREVFVGSSTEFTVVVSREGTPKALYLWVGSEALNILPILRNSCSLSFGDSVVDVRLWVEASIAVDFGLLGELEEYVSLLKSMGFEKLRGKKVLTAYSGGKDSNAVVYLLKRLSEDLGFELRVVYVHMPFLEPIHNLKAVEELSKRLGVEVEILEPPRKIVLRYLLKEGLPYRGFRWCTYLKTRPIRDYAKKLEARMLAVGDRVWEALKRTSRLLEALERGRLVRKGFAYPVAPLTLLDVIELCKRVGLVHPSYLRGATRVSCLYCPYKAAYELRLGEEVEDEGLIEEVLRREWRRWYRDHVSFEDFVSENLWRYTPRVAKAFASLKRAVLKLSEAYGLDRITVEHAAQLHSEVWRSAGSKRLVGVSEAIAAAKRLLKALDARECLRVVTLAQAQARAS